MTTATELTRRRAHARRRCRRQVWKIQVGRVRLYLLDTNIPQNPRRRRDITAQLYGGDIDMRIKQEIVLGIGGMRALEALGIKPDRLPHERRPLRVPGAGAHPRCSMASSTI